MAKHKATKTTTTRARISRGCAGVAATTLLISGLAAPSAFSTQLPEADIAQEEQVATSQVRLIPVLQDEGTVKLFAMTDYAELVTEFRIAFSSHRTNPNGDSGVSTIFSLTADTDEILTVSDEEFILEGVKEDGNKYERLIIVKQVSSAPGEVTFSATMGDAVFRDDAEVITSPTVAVDDEVTVEAGNHAVIRLLDNDLLTDDFDARTLSLSGGAGGVFYGATDQQLVYAPVEGFIGTDTLTYTITAPEGYTSSATITVNVIEAPAVEEVVDEVVDEPHGSEPAESIEVEEEAPAPERVFSAKAAAAPAPAPAPAAAPAVEDAAPAPAPAAPAVEGADAQADTPRALIGGGEDSTTSDEPTSPVADDAEDTPNALLNLDAPPVQDEVRADTGPAGEGDHSRRVDEGRGIVITPGQVASSDDSLVAVDSLPETGADIRIGFVAATLALLGGAAVLVRKRLGMKVSGNAAH